MSVEKECAKCKQKEFQNVEYHNFCFQHDYCSFKQREDLPKYSLEVAKQLIYNCSMNLLNGSVPRKEVADKLSYIVNELDKMKESKFRI